MNKLIHSEIQTVDNILSFLYSCNPPDCVCEYETLKLHITEIQNTDIKRRIEGILIANNLCEYVGSSNSAYKLTPNGKKIKIEHNSYKEYIKHIEDKEKRENEMYENSKTSIKIANKSFKWTIWNTIFVIIGVIITAITLYYTINPQR